MGDMGDIGIGILVSYRYIGIGMDQSPRIGIGTGDTGDIDIGISV